jgi:acyl-CoA reductase-like NAD-dependent aldehyde dehydrogenase
VRRPVFSDDTNYTDLGIDLRPQAHPGGKRPSVVPTIADTAHSSRLFRNKCMSEKLLPDHVSIAHPDCLFIGGEWVKPAREGMIEIVCPNSERVVARVAEATETDMDAAVLAARRAFDGGSWALSEPRMRIAKIREMVAYLTSRQKELESAYTAQVGALSTIAAWVSAMATANLAAHADLGERFEWVKVFAQDDDKTTLIVHEAVGVVAAIAPWNAPYATMMQKLAPSLLAGNAVIMKPSPESPLEAYIMAEAAQAVGLPAGVVNLVPSHREAADHLVCNPGVDKVTFTGSTVAGRRIGSVCGARVGRVTLELGGKSAVIVADDMPTAAAARILARSATMMSGQVCALLSRAIVPTRRHDELAEAVAAEMKTIRVGHSTDPQTEMGPLAMRRQLDRVEGYIAKGKEEGATLMVGGGRPAHLNSGFFIEPTLFANVDNASTIAQEEIFGPVLSMIKADDMDHAVAIANDTIYGLNGAVLTQDNALAYRVARRIRTGNVGQNAVRGTDGLPFGGFKQSGIGRENGSIGLMPYLEVKTVVLAKPLDAY